MTLRRVLLVDDDPDLAALFREILTAEGYEVYCTEDPHAALELVRMKIFPVIFIDMNLNSTSGSALCLEIRKLTDKSRIIAWTGDTSLRKEECLGAGFDNLLHKPVPILQLIAITDESYDSFQI